MQHLFSPSVPDKLKVFFQISLLFCFCSFYTAKAQNPVSVSFEITDAKDYKFHEKKQKKNSGPLSIENEIQSKLLHLFAEGYLAARVDSITDADSTTRICYFTIGNKYKWAKLSKGNVDEGLLSLIGFREKIYHEQPLNFKEVERIGKSLLLWCENNGYPFAAFKLDSVTYKETEIIEASLYLNKNKGIKVDSVLVVGDAKINPVYLYNYIGIKPGDPYNESQFLKIPTRIKELPFLKEMRSHEMVFTEGTSKLIFHLGQKQANRFDGILGVLPDETTPGKLLITGDVALKLLNSFGNGELIDINWRKLQNETQDLRTQFTYPFILSTPFGLDLKFDLYKRDSTFINLNPVLGIQYLLMGGNYFKVFINQRSSRLQSTHGLELISHLPPYADITSTLYGIGVKFEEIDYRLNPKKGYKIVANAAVGNKVILKHPRINEKVYEGVELKTVQYDVNLNVDFFIPLAKRSTIKLGTFSAMLLNRNPFENELYRIGGLKTLRGFDEESILASSFSIFTIEARYLLEQNSYAHVFWNGAWYENNTQNKLITSLPWGFGAGMSFETKAGIFSLSYALGKQFDNPFQFRTGKIHFGILNYF